MQLHGHWMGNCCVMKTWDMQVQASLEDLNQNLSEGSPAIPMNRFRPNVIVSGATPWEEDKWESFTAGGVHFRSAKPCDRCKVCRLHTQGHEISLWRECMSVQGVLVR